MKKRYCKIGKQDSIEDFLEAWISVSTSDQEYPPYYFSGATFADAECTEMVIGGHKRRTFDAILELVNTYYPETSPERLAVALRNANVWFGWCGQVRDHTALRLNIKNQRDELEYIFNGSAHLFDDKSKFLVKPGNTFERQQSVKRFQELLDKGRETISKGEYTPSGVETVNIL